MSHSYLYAVISMISVTLFRPLCTQNCELLEEARAAKCYRDELDIVKEKVSETVVVLWLKSVVINVSAKNTF